MGIVALVAFTLGVLTGARTGCCETTFPGDTLLEFSLQSDERPANYTILMNDPLLERLGMQSNPDFISVPSETETVAQFGGALSFAAIYGLAAAPRLIVNGVFFPDPMRAATFAELQRTKDRQVMALECRRRDGCWLLLVARDPEATYTPDEVRGIAEGLDAYRRRLDLRLVFDDLTNAPAATVE